MAKKKAKSDKQEPKAEVQEEAVDPFIGGEEDDLSDMEYIQDETTKSTTETHPPATAEEAELFKEQELDPTPVVDEKDKEEEEEKEVKEDEPKAESEEDEPKAETPEEAEPEAEPKLLEDEPGIPKKRFDEVNERMKKAESDNKSLKEQLDTVVEEKSAPEPEPYDYAAKEKEAMDAILEGDQDKYSRIRAEIRSAERSETLREANKLAAEGDTKLKQTLTFEEAGAKIEDLYPTLSETDENFNAPAREELLDLYVGYAKSGRYTSVAALQKASEVVAKIYDLDAPTEEIEEKTPDNVVKIKQPDVKKKTKMAEDQPPDLDSRAPGTSEEANVDVMAMPDDDFEALPESTKRRLRGDIYTG